MQRRPCVEPILSNHLLRSYVPHTPPIRIASLKTDAKPDATTHDRANQRADRSANSDPFPSAIDGTHAAPVRVANRKTYAKPDATAHGCANRRADRRADRRGCSVADSLSDKWPFGNNNLPHSDFNQSFNGLLG